MVEQDVIQEKLVGIWRLVKSMEIKPDDTIYYPFGEDAIGYITYTPVGIMTVHIMRKNRTLFSGDNLRQASAEECLRIPQDYLAYFGRYEIDIVKQVVNHYVEGSLFPNNIGSILPRSYQFIGNRLSLKPADGTNREIIWEKSLKLEGTMFIAISTYKKPIQEVDLHREAHRRFLKTYIENKMFIVSGGRLPKEGGVILAKVKTRKQLNEILNQDPFIKANVSEYKVYEFNPGLWDESFSGFIES